MTKTHRKRGLVRDGSLDYRGWALRVEDLDCGRTERRRKNTETMVNEERKNGLKRMCNTQLKPEARFGIEDCGRMEQGRKQTANMD